MVNAVTPSAVRGHYGRRLAPDCGQFPYVVQPYFPYGVCFSGAPRIAGAVAHPGLHREQASPSPMGPTFNYPGKQSNKGVTMATETHPTDAHQGGIMTATGNNDATASPPAATSVWSP